MSYHHCQKQHLSFKQPPHIAGKWQVIERRITQANPNINHPEVIKFVAEFEQNQEFVKSVPSTSERLPMLGVWRRLFDHKTRFNGWELILVDSDSDNDTFVFQVTKLTKHNIALKMESANYEAGFSLGNPTQHPNVGTSIWKRLSVIL